MAAYQEIEYQELESTKYFNDCDEKVLRREQIKHKFVEDVWNLTAFYSVVLVVGFFVLHFSGVSITDIFQLGVNEVVDWSISN